MKYEWKCSREILYSLFRHCSVTGISMAFTIAEEEKPKEFASGGFHYVLRDDGSVKIINWIGKKNDCIVPEVIDGKRVTGIGDADALDWLND